MCKLIEGLQNIAKNEALNAMRLAYSMDEEGTACIDDIKLQVDIAKEMMEVYLACEKEIFDRWKSGSIEELLEKSGLQEDGYNAENGIFSAQAEAEFKYL